jgi:hypothetical protein
MGAFAIDLEDRMSVMFRRTAMFGFGAALEAVWVGLARAQVNPPPASARGPALLSDTTATSQVVAPAVASEAATVPELPVLYVTSVEILRTAVEPRLDIVRVTGVTSSAGWSAPQLVPTYAGKPSDEILDLQFIATIPEQSEDAEGFSPIGAIFPIEQDHPFKGVRVRASENAIEVKQTPGSGQAMIDVDDCKDCVGKKFAAATQAQPKQQGVIREQDLPKMVRIIRPSDGIRGMEQNPNRLTLVLSDDNTIVEAFWE